MATLNHRRTQSLLLIQRLLNLRERSSPFNVIIDNLEQSAGPLVLEYIQQARNHGDTIVYVSFECLQPPAGVTHFIRARRRPMPEIHRELENLVQPPKRSLVIVDSIHPLLANNSNIAKILPSFTTPTSSLVVVYHESTATIGDNGNKLAPYAPTTLQLLTYLATTVVYVYSLAQAKAKYDASILSQAEPVFGVEEDTDGLVAGLNANVKSGVLIEMEHRRRSGRAVGLNFVLHPIRPQARSTEVRYVLRDEHPAFRIAYDIACPDAPDFSTGTFSLELTDKQRQARKDIVLPYFDAQVGGVSGGRILYEMDREDDFDEEEDEM